jgi:hypothetical protein
MNQDGIFETRAQWKMRYQHQNEPIDTLRVALTDIIATLGIVRPSGQQAWE